MITEDNKMYSTDFHGFSLIYYFILWAIFNRTDFLSFIAHFNMKSLNITDKAIRQTETAFDTKLQFIKIINHWFFLYFR